MIRMLNDTSDPNEHPCHPAERLQKRKWILRIALEPQDEKHCYIYTIGLTWFSRPELVMCHVPVFAASFAMRVMRNLGQHCLDIGPLTAGQIYPVGVEDMQVTLLHGTPEQARLLRECPELFPTGFSVLAVKPA